MRVKHAAICLMKGCGSSAVGCKLGSLWLLLSQHSSGQNFYRSALVSHMLLSIPLAQHLHG